MDETPVTSPKQEETISLQSFATYAKKGCRHCFGRGYRGIVVGTNEIITCICVYKNIANFKPETGGDSGTQDG